MFKINAELRIAIKTAGVRRLRNQEKCPAIIYYKNKKFENLPIILNNKDIQHPNSIIHFYKNNILKLNIQNKSIVQVQIKEIQYHPYRSKIIHIDFMCFKYN
ncbi:50S ribosomal protein L25 [Candidatus Blochmanniella vafra str. BVAF]|uniref:50S ribosomal protein L25 n=1 Tax=Blochmanniella vafra (strain BVAF) TaxID=859654 RepID=E8Q736_BLOVB|nr:50S ribosomal protein L25 [Candidatus Blochmannia vafer]ADV33860.1 50S ribosomal protein L25 [Candidatus Blochmannia vafer str. BVAF]